MAGVGRPRQYGNRTSTGVRIEPELHAALKQAAKEREPVVTERLAELEPMRLVPTRASLRVAEGAATT